MSIRIDCINFSLNLQMMILQVFVGNIIFIFIIGHWGILGPQNPWMSSVPLDKRLRVYYISQPMWAPCLWEVPVFIWLLILQSIFRNIPQLIYNTFLSSFFFFFSTPQHVKPTPVFLPGESQGTGEPGGLPPMGSHRVGHDWSNLAAAACGNISSPIRD